MKERAGKKKVVLELGGNAGVIVDETADLDWAVKRVSSARSPTPVRCASASSACSSTRTSGTRSWTASSPARPSAEARRSARSRRRISGRWSTSTAAGADPALGRRGGRAGWHGARWAATADGTFFPPTVLTDVPPTAQVCTQRGVRAARRGLPVPRPRRGHRRGQRLVVRPAVRCLHERPGRRLASVRRARGRRA